MTSKLIKLIALLGLIGKQVACFSFNFNTKGVTTGDYASFGSGLSISMLVEVAANSPEYPCLSSTANIATSVYSMIYYYDQYQTDKNTTDLAGLIANGVNFVLAT